MTQGDLFDMLEIPPFMGGRRCGECVHRNARVNAPTGYCTPVGWRAADDQACDQWFGMTQLRLSLAKRP